MLFKDQLDQLKSLLTLYIFHYVLYSSRKTVLTNSPSCFFDHLVNGQQQPSSINVFHAPLSCVINKLPRIRTAGNSLQDCWHLNKPKTARPCYGRLGAMETFLVVTLLK